LQVIPRTSGDEQTVPLNGTLMVFGDDAPYLEIDPAGMSIRFGTDHWVHALDGVVTC